MIQFNCATIYYVLHKKLILLTLELINLNIIFSKLYTNLFNKTIILYKSILLSSGLFNMLHWEFIIFLLPCTI